MLGRFARTWPDGVKPKIHYSSPRTEMREVQRKNRKTGKQERVLVAPVWTGHADFVNPFEFITFCRAAGKPSADILLEAKAKDLALLRLRRDLAIYAPDVSAFFGAPAAVVEPDEVLVEGRAS
jgi:UV DNA damage endonuclease